MVSRRCCCVRLNNKKAKNPNCCECFAVSVSQAYRPGAGALKQMIFTVAHLNCPANMTSLPKNREPFKIKAHIGNG